MTVESDLMKGVFNSATAQEVGIRLLEVLGDRPFTVFDPATPTHGSRVLRLVGGETAVAFHPEAIRSCLVLNTTHGYVELAFGLSPHHRKITYEFTAEGAFVIRDFGQRGSAKVVQPLGPPRSQPGLPSVFMASREYPLHSGNVDQVAHELDRRLSGRTVVFANPDSVQGLDRYRFPLVKAVWVGRGFDSRLVLEVEGEELDEERLEDQVFLLGAPEHPNSLGELVAVTFHRNRTVQLVVRPTGNMFRRTYVYWAVPNL